jgi:DNA-directed RNA polymerase specialized sigma24 family protein
VDAALQALRQRDPDLARLVELRFFVGLSVEETADVLGVSRATVGREWAAARAFLALELERSP